MTNNAEHGPIKLDPSKSGFLNPYSFVSIPDREGLPPELADGEPMGHDRFSPGHWSGSIPITLTTLTPLLLPDHARAAADGVDDTRQAPPPLPVRVDHESRPVLAGSAVKGMLRSAYEAITNSRFGVFVGHDTPLAIRATATRDVADRLKPAMVVERDHDADTARIRWVKTLNPKLWVPPGPDPHPAVWVPLDLARDHEDGATVEAWIYLAEHTAKRFRVWRAASLHKPGESPAQAPGAKLVRTLHEIDYPAVKVIGRLHRTESLFPADPSRNKKHDERLVVERVLTDGLAELDNHYADIEDDDGRLITAWRAVINSFVRAHESDSDLRCFGTYVRRPEKWRPLEEGRTLHAEVDEKNRVVALYPAMIGRKPFPLAPEELLPELHHPSPTRQQLSPADRVFGWARPPAVDEAPGAHRGHLRVEPSIAGPGKKSVRELRHPLPLTTLNSPKPAQFLFYLSDDAGKTLRGEHKHPDNGYSDKDGRQRRLRGRKVYLTHAEVLADQSGASSYWGPPAQPVTPKTTPKSATVDGRTRYREYIAPQGFKENVTTSITHWVNPNATFRAVLRVDNLTRTELGALLWLLNLPEGAALRLGLGKPLGFGALRVQVDWQNVCLYTSDSLLDRYRALGTQANPESVDTVRALATDFDELLLADQHLSVVRTEFLTAARGFLGAPVHYPRTTPSKSNAESKESPPQAESYKWWVENDRTGRDYPNRRVALPRLTDKHVRLPYYRDKP